MTASTGLVVDLRVVRPADIAGRLPLVVLLGGHRTGRDAVDVVGYPGAMVVAALAVGSQATAEPVVRNGQLHRFITAPKR